MKMVALIPARAGSKRIPGKNFKALGGQPLLAWTIQAAQESGVFTGITVSTDDEEIRAIAYRYGAHGMYRLTRPTPDDSPDIEWVRDYFERLGERADAFAILRPTSPFRTADTIRRAYARFQTQEVHSMRAVQPVKEHPGKMWTWQGDGYPIVPLMGWASRSDISPLNTTPFHSQPTQTLPRVYVQNASLEMAWSWVVPAFGTISGTKVAPFFTGGYEGVDLNTMDDWREAERLIQEGHVALPTLARV